MSADQSSNQNGSLKEEIKKEFPVNDKAEEKCIENNFSILEHVKFNDCEVNVFHSHWRVLYCFSLGIQTHARDVVYILWLVVDLLNY